MSKRTRGAATRTTQRRPGQRPAGARPPTARSADSPTPRPPSQLLAAEGIADEIVEGRPDRATAQLGAVARSTPSRSRAKPSGLLAAKAATEYVYVAQDLRRILMVAALVFGIMLVLWILLEVMHIVRI